MKENTRAFTCSLLTAAAFAFAFPAPTQAAEPGHNPGPEGSRNERSEREVFRGGDRPGPQQRENAMERRGPGRPGEMQEREMEERRIRRFDDGDFMPEVRAPRSPRGPAPFARPARDPRSGSQEQRVEHLEQALRHLQAAGLPELAERVEVRLNELRAERRQRQNPEANELRQRLDQLGREHENLQREVRNLKMRLEQQNSRHREERHEREIEIEKHEDKK